jgi:hypothetical protein
MGAAKRQRRVNYWRYSGVPFAKGATGMLPTGRTRRIRVTPHGLMKRSMSGSKIALKGRFR